MPASCTTAASAGPPSPSSSSARRELGDPLRDERLRRRHEHQRLLEQPPAAHEQVLLAAALRVVAGIRLVHREDEQLDRRHRQVDVDCDPAAEVAEVVAERQPGLVAHDLQVDALAGRQVDEAARPGARLLDHRRHRALDLLGGHADRVLPALVPLGQRPVAREQLLEPLVRGREDGLVGVGRPHAVAPLDLVGVRAGLAGQHARVRAQARPPGRAASRPRARRAAPRRRTTSARGSTGGAASTAAASSGGPK